MASNSEELLTGDDIERILAAIDSDILAESHDLWTDFTATVSEIKDINCESCFFLPRFQKKHIKQKL